jgi:sulfatase modifying factor 1
MNIRCISKLAGGVVLALAVSFGPAGLSADPAETSMATVPAGVHRPLFRSDNEPKEIPVKAFLLDRFPVSNGEFLEFVRANPKWQRSRAKRLFVDESYLTHWAGDLDLGTTPQIATQPVTHISWFAAKAYCAWKNKRLPTTTEWELVAGTGFASRDGAVEPEYVAALHRWYSTPTPETLPSVGTGRANLFGIHDLHGLVWEWTADFNSSLLTGDARGDSGLERQLFCGAGAQGASDRANFPAFMRYGFRSSLKAGYSVHNLGFRCAKDL